MTEPITYTGDLLGLNDKDISLLQQQYGKNKFHVEAQRNIGHILLDIVRDPMFILLSVSCALYFILGQYNEGFMMLVAIVLVSSISLYQEARSTKALQALKEYAEPKVTVIREGREQYISGDELVPGDIVLLEEGNKVPADATIIQENDLTLNESVITGESLPVRKQKTNPETIIYQGTTINTGKCYALVIATGNQTLLGKLGKSISGYSSSQTLLQQQTRKFVRQITFFGLSAFVLIWFVNYLDTGSWSRSLLIGLTLAMSAIPEEIPVAFTSFMALGAYHLAKLGIITRQPQTVENLGAVSVICLDKTGTITENNMEVKTIYIYESDSLLELDKINTTTGNRLIYYAMLASEQNPFDAMEKAIHNAYNTVSGNSSNAPRQMVHEYELSGQPPMMTHVYQQGETQMVAAKGAAEKIIAVCSLGDAVLTKINGYINQLASKGYRVIGVASAVHSTGPLPEQQEDFQWTFEGLLCLYDPPRKNMDKFFQQIYRAKIAVKLLTGDYPGTAVNIAEQVGIQSSSEYLTGEQVMKLNQEELKVALDRVTIFARMFPDAKLKIINALKSDGEIVAMTGDGVNDGPALKSADIGIAMGKKGTEIARQAADLVLTDDNPEKIIAAIYQGRKIFYNLKKAIRYILSIHIPIILTASLPVLLGWKFPNLFTPVHVIFLELIMGPTCSIFFEREPVEKDSMSVGPRDRNQGLFTWSEIMISIVQGVVLSAGVLALYYFSMRNGQTLEVTRAIVFTTLILGNIFLTFVNRSFTETIVQTIRYKNNLAPWVMGFSGLLLLLVHKVGFVRELFGFMPISAMQFGLATAVAFISVMWFELYKAFVVVFRKKSTN